MASGLTSQYQIPYPLQTDGVDVAGDMQSLATTIDSILFTKSDSESPTLSGIPTAPTAFPDTNTTQIATTEFVINQGYLKENSASSIYAPIDSPNLSGIPTAPDIISGTSTTQIANTNFVVTEIHNHTSLVSDVHGVSGEVVGTNNAQILTNKSISGESNTFTDIPQTAIVGLEGAYAPLNLEFVEKTSSYTLAVGDAAKQIEMNLSSTNTLTIPTDANGSFPIGTTVLIVQTGTGQTTIAGQPGVTVNATPGLKLRTRWSLATLIKRGVNNWLVTGDLSA
jgi:hypothetical protein